MSQSILQTCLWLPAVSTAVSYRPYLTELHTGETLLSWAINRLSSAGLPPPVHVTAFSARDEEYIRRVATHMSAYCCRLRPRGSRLPSLLEMLGSGATRSIAVFTLPSLLLPLTALGDVCRRHIADGNWFTCLAGVPVGAEVYDRRALEYLAANLPEGYSLDPMMALRMLASIEPSGTEEERPKVAIVSAVPSLAVPGRDLTGFSSDFTTPDEVEDLVRVLQAPSAPEVNLFDQWQEAHFRNTALRTRRRIGEQVACRRSGLRRDQPMRVLFVTPATAFSGSESSLCELVKALTDIGVQALVAVRYPGTLTERLEKAGARFVCAYCDFAQPSSGSYLFARGLVREWHPDVVHLEGYLGLPFPAAALAESVPIVQHVRIADVAQIGDQLRCASAVVAVSDFVGRECLRYGLEAGRVNVVHNGFDLQALRSPRPTASAVPGLEVPAGSWIVLTIARYAPSKRLDFLLHAVALARARIPSLQLVLVGDPALNPEGNFRIRQLIDQLRLRDCVTEVEFCSDVVALERAANVAVLTSIREPFARFICECMIVGTPVILAGTGGLHEILIHEKNGLCCSPDAPGSLAEALVYAFEHPSAMAALAERATATADAWLTRERYARQILAVYRQLLQADEAPATTVAGTVGA